MNVKKLTFAFASIFILAGIAGPAQSSQVAAKTYVSCADVLKKYPNGVAINTKARNKAIKGGFTRPKVSKGLYKKNSKRLDKNNNGIICEQKKVVNFTDGYFSLSRNSWGDDWSPDVGPSNCQDRSAFPNENVSSRGQFNLELITGKKFAEITRTDLTSILQLEFSDFPRVKGDFVRSDSLKSYEGLEYLTCLQWLRLGGEDLGRDFRFLHELTDLRYLDLEPAWLFFHVEQLFALQKLETISLPNAFRSLNDLVAIPSLKRIYAVGNKASCDIEPVLKRPHLEELHMKDSFHHKRSQPPAEENDFKLSRDPSGRYLQLLQKGGADTLNPDYDPKQLSRIHDDS